MKKIVRNAVVAGGALMILGSLVGFLAGGMRPYTRIRDESLAQANMETGLSDLLAETGASDEAPPPAADNVNALGFLPSGPGLASLSVVTIGGPGAVAIVGVLWWNRRRRRVASGS